ncbi:MAG: hypothetical protein M5U22_06670 [Thermoleophilia bacterium]|nr:hypothetical protein [Thermoleophilia bacterium]
MNFLSAQIREAQVIVWGRVVGVEAPRWNSPDGKEWHGTTDGELPIMYVTYAVEPAEVWKGPQASGLVLLLGPAEIRPDDGATGSDGGLPGGGLAVGDEVVAFGVAKPQYGPTADDAYWLVHDGSSVFRKTGGLFGRLESVPGDPEGNTLTRSALRGLVGGTQ